VTTNDDLLAKLPRVARDAFARALAAPRDDHKTRRAETVIAWDAVGIPKGELGFPVHALPTSFDEAQRAALELSARNDLGAVPYTCPAAPKTLRTWLGLEPGVLETLVVDDEPLWRALEKARTVGGQIAILDALPCDVALRALGELYTSGFGYGINSQLILEGGPRLLRDLRDEGRAWALAQADAMRDVPKHGSALGAFVFLALVRAGVPIEPRWDWFFPTRLPKELLFECARAIPEERRAEVLGPRLQSIPWKIEMIAEFRSAPMARALLDSSEPNSLRWTYLVEQLRALGKEHPTIAAVAESAVAAAPKPIELRVTRVAQPTRAKELTPLEREQLTIGVRGLDDGEDLDAEKVLGEGCAKGWLEIRNIASASGQALYDAFTYVDNGVIFRAGTTEEVAWLAQGGVVLKERDDALRNALQIAISSMALGLAQAKKE
jgi:hypothetical protein